MKIFKKSLLALAFVMVLTPMLALAAYTGPEAGPTTLNDITGIIDTVVNWFSVIVFLLAIFFLLWAGLSWMTAGGDESKTSAARNRLIYGLIGIAVALFAGVAQTFIENLIS
mgnify:CR=1 FL=1